MKISIRTFAHGLAAATVVGVLVLATACGTTGGVAITASSTSPSGQTSAPIGTTVTDGPVSSTPVTTNPGPPTCQETPNKLTTPTGTPIITVTQGANAWIANRATEPLALALYPDGSALASRGIGEGSKPLAQMRLGYVPSCIVEWAKSELEELATLDMGDARITDQGTTTVTYRPAGGAPVKISVYALGLGDQYATSGKQNRARLTSVITALREPEENAATWTPTRLKIFAAPGLESSDGPALVWPGRTPLDQVLKGTSIYRCGVISGADAAAVLKTLGQRQVDGPWTDAGTVTGLSIGILVPGQDGCPAG